MNKTLASAFQIATLLFSASVFGVTEKGQHEGLLLDSRIKYADSGRREIESKVVLNGDNWTLVTRTPWGHLLYGRTEKIAAATTDNETIRVLYRETDEAGTEVGASAATASVGAPTTIDLKDARIESRVSKIRYQLE